MLSPAPLPFPELRSALPTAVNPIEVPYIVLPPSFRAAAQPPALYYTAKLLAQVAQNLLYAALFVLAGTSSHAAIDVSSLFVAILLPAAFFGVAGGAIADRVGPARGFMLGSLLRFAVVALAFFVLGGPNSAWAIAFAFGTVSQVSQPAEMALVRTIRPADHTGRSHSIIVAIQYAGQGLGMLALAPLLYLVGGTHLILAGAGVGFLLLTVLTALLSLRLQNIAAEQVQPVHDAFSFRAVTRFFRSEGLARDAVTVLAVKSMAAQGILVTLPLYVRHDIGIGREAIAFLVLPGVAGAIAGLIWTGGMLTPQRARSIMRLCLVGLIVGVFALASLDYGITAVFEFSQIPPLVHFSLALNTTYIVALPVAFILGTALSASVVSARVVLTETAPIGQQARVFAVQSTLTDSIVVLPLLLLGVGAQFAGARPTLAAIGIIATLAFIAMEHPRFRPALRAEPMLAPEKSSSLSA